MVKKLSMYVGPHDVYPTIDVNFSILTRECKNKKLVDNIFSSTLFCYQCVNYKTIIALKPNFSQLGLRPRRLRIKRYHARFRAIMVNYACRCDVISTVSQMFARRGDVVQAWPKVRAKKRMQCVA